MATIDDWTFRLTGLPVDRIEQARATIDAFGIDHLSNELTRRADIDAASAACMLESAIDALKDRGVNENKLIGKLRRDPDVWPSVTELIAGRSVLRFFDPNSEIELDSRPAKAGPNADFRIREPGSKSGVSIEFSQLVFLRPRPTSSAAPHWSSQDSAQTAVSARPTSRSRTIVQFPCRVARNGESLPARTGEDRRSFHHTSESCTAGSSQHTTRNTATSSECGGWLRAPSAS